jgi:hypothetical protein
MAYNSPRLYLYKRTSQIYYIGYYDNGRLRWKSTCHKTRPEALRTLSQFKEPLQAGHRLPRNSQLHRALGNCS